MTHPMSPPTTEAVEKLRSALVEELSTIADDRILGAQLGTRLNALMSPNTYKSWLNEGSQNLRAFAVAFLGGIISPTDQRQGLDYLFQIEGKSQQVYQSFGGALWKAFCTVRPAHAIRFEPRKNALYLSPVGSDQTIDHPIVVPVSEIEHRAMCLAFVKDLESTGHNNPQLADIANAFSPASYAVWVSALKSTPGLFKGWGSFRVEHIKRLFAHRLDAITSDDEIRARLKGEFVADYESQRKQLFGSIAPQVTNTAAPAAIGRAVDHGSRQLLTKALETLDDNQLSKILVPMDVVMALLAQHKQ